MDYRYLKLGFTFFFIVFGIGVIFIYLKAKNVIPPIVRFDNYQYQKSLIQKSVSILDISLDKGYLQIDGLDLYVYGLSKTSYILKDFKRKGKRFVFIGSTGLNGEVLPILIDIKVSNIKPINTFSIRIKREDLDKYINLNKKRFIIDLGSFIYVSSNDDRCGVVKYKEEKNLIVCNIDRDIKSIKDLDVGLYLISPHSVEKLPSSINRKEIFNKKNLVKLKPYIRNLVLSDIYLEPNIKHKIENDFINLVKTIFKLKRFNIEKIEFKTKG